jgi:uncharacterized protein
MKKTIIALVILACFLLPLHADLSELVKSYVTDGAGLLSTEQCKELENTAKKISEQYSIDVRIITVNSLGEYGYNDIELFTYDIWKNNSIGYGSDKSTVLLALSMQDRDFDLRDWGTKAFTFYGIDILYDRHLLPFLKNNNYYDAFAAFLLQSEKYLSMAEAGKPFSRGTDPDFQKLYLGIGIPGSILLSFLIAFFILSVWKSKMKTAKHAKLADTYIPEGGLKLTAKEDTFLYRTTTRVKMQTAPPSSGSSSGSASSGRGGSSGRSGRF